MNAPVHTHDPDERLSWQVNLGDRTFSFFALDWNDAVRKANAVVDAVIGWPTWFGRWLPGGPDHPRTIHGVPNRLERAINTVASELAGESIGDQLDAVAMTAPDPRAPVPDHVITARLEALS